MTCLADLLPKGEDCEEVFTRSGYGDFLMKDRYSHALYAWVEDNLPKGGFVWIVLDQFTIRIQTAAVRPCPAPTVLTVYPDGRWQEVEK
jgi:hypothetical protein